MADSPNFVIGSLTDKGRVRTGNEDSIGTPAMFQIPPALQMQRGILIAVADGMGGHAAGEVASAMTIKALFQSYYSSSDPNPETALRTAYTQANTQVYAVAAADPTKARMGTTLVSIVIKGDQFTWANVGDSRAYLLRDNRIEQLTFDHSWVAEQVRNGTLTAEQAEQHEFKNVITRAIGLGPTVEPDFRTDRLQPNDQLLLCSDGLSNEIPAPEMLALLKNAASAPAGAKRLIDTANARGARDNVSAIVLRRATQAAGISPLVFAVPALALILVIAGLVFLQNGPAPMPPTENANVPAGVATQLPSVQNTMPTGANTVLPTLGNIPSQTNVPTVNPLRQVPDFAKNTPTIIPPTATWTPTAIPIVNTDTPVPTETEKPEKPTKDPNPPTEEKPTAEKPPTKPACLIPPCP